MYYTLSINQMRPVLWEGHPGQPTMIVASSCYQGGKLRLRTMPPQCRPLACDSGGFTFARKGIDYPFTPAEYIAWLTHYQPQWAACMDYPCEAEIAPDDEAIRDRQARTLAHAATLMAHPGTWAWVPVLQGRTIPQYLEHAAQYRQAGLVRPLMGIGSLCRRTDVEEIARIVAALAEALPDTRFHLFGVKMQVFKRRIALPASVESADSAAWNGNFGTARHTNRHARQAEGRTQAWWEVQRSLPAYQAKVNDALSQPKQLMLL